MIEEFKDFEYDGITYKVSNLGRVFGKKGELKQRLNKDGYSLVTLGSGGGDFARRGRRRRNFSVHRLVAICFIPNPNNLSEVNHKDFDRTNNRVDNLEWLSHSDNVKYSATHNKQVISEARQGVKNGRAKYTEEDVRLIRQMYSEGYTIMDIIVHFYPELEGKEHYRERKNKHSRISDIAKRKTFKNVA